MNKRQKILFGIIGIIIMAVLIGIVGYKLDVFKLGTEIGNPIIGEAP